MTGLRDVKVREILYVPFFAPFNYQRKMWSLFLLLLYTQQIGIHADPLIIGTLRTFRLLHHTKDQSAITAQQGENSFDSDEETTVWREVDRLLDGTMSMESFFTVLPTLTPSETVEKTNQPVTFQEETPSPAIADVAHPNGKITSAEPTQVPRTLAPTRIGDTLVPTFSPISNDDTLVPSFTPMRNDDTLVPSASPIASDDTPVPSFTPIASDDTPVPSFAPMRNDDTLVPSASPIASDDTPVPSFTPIASDDTPVPSASPIANVDSRVPRMSPIWKDDTLIPSFSPVRNGETLVPSVSPIWNDDTSVPSFRPTNSPSEGIFFVTEPAPQPQINGDLHPAIEVIANQSCFSTLSQLINLTASVPLINRFLLDDPITIFAPTDKAFKSFGDQEYLNDLMKPEFSLQLRDLLLYHATAGKLDVPDVADPKKPTIMMLASGAVPVSSNESGIFLESFAPRLAKVGNQSIGSNGFIYQIDTVLLPFSATISVYEYMALYDVAFEIPKYTVFRKLVETAGYKDSLGALNDMTIFAPSDDRISNATAAFLLEETNAAILDAIVRYHWADRVVNYLDDANGGIATLFQNERLALDPSLARVEGRMILTFSVVRRGVIYEIDGLLIPPMYQNVIPTVGFPEE